jgi:hypothetical protein
MFISESHKQTFSVNFDYEEARAILNGDETKLEELADIMQKVVTWKDNQKTIFTKRLFNKK